MILIEDFAKYRPVIKKMLETNMGLTKDMSILVLSDIVGPNQEGKIEDILKKQGTSAEDVEIRNEFARLVANTAQDITSSENVRFEEFPVTLQHSAEPKSVISEAMKMYNVLVAPTTFSLTHTQARKDASRAGVAIATLPMMKPIMFNPGGPIDANYTWIKETAIPLATLMTEQRYAHLTAPGTDMLFEFDSRVNADHGFAQLATKQFLNGVGFGMINMPSGEADGSPSNANGYFTSPVGCGKVTKKPLFIEVRNGLVISIDGGGNLGDTLRESAGLPKTITKRNMYARNIAELGVGLNMNAALGNGTLEDEKVLGTCHVAIGNDDTYDGGLCAKAGFHEDLIVPKATLIVGRTKATSVLEEGKFTYRPLPVA